MNTTGPFTAQTWDGEQLIAEIIDLSFDAARHIAQAATVTGHTGRLMADNGEDYCEIYCSDGSSRRGTFAEVALVRGGQS